MKKVSLIMCAWVFVWNSSAYSAVSFFDDTFQNSDWVIVEHAIGAGGASSGTQMTSGGNPGAYRQVTTAISGASGERRIFSFNFKNGATYAPQSKGAIDSIDYSEDAIMIPGNQTIGVGLRQDGHLFMYTLVGSFSGTSWTAQNITSLKADDFAGAVASGFDPNLNPDFSSTGSVIEFGFVRGRGSPIGGPVETSIGGIDNWSVTINNLSPVPTISEWGMIIFFILLVLSAVWVMRRRTGQESA